VRQGQNRKLADTLVVADGEQQACRPTPIGCSMRLNNRDSPWGSTINTRESLMNIVKCLITGERPVTELKTAFTVAGGPPKILRIGNGRELVPQALQRFCDGKTGLV
jgi:hypothetical protein